MVSIEKVVMNMVFCSYELNSVTELTNVPENECCYELKLSYARVTTRNI